MMKYILRNHRKKAPRPARARSGPWAKSLMNIENTTDHDYNDIYTLLNQQRPYKHHIRTSILDFGIAMIYFFTTAILLTKDVLSLALSFLVQASSRLQYERSRYVGNIGNVGDIGFRTDIRTRRKCQKLRSATSRLVLQSYKLSNVYGYLGDYKKCSHESYDDEHQSVHQSRKPSNAHGCHGDNKQYSHRSYDSGPRLILQPRKRLNANGYLGEYKRHSHRSYDDGLRLVLQLRKPLNANGYLGGYKRRRQDSYDPTSVTLSKERSLEGARNMISLDNGSGAGEQSLKEGSHMTDPSVTLGENTHNHGTGFAINHQPSSSDETTKHTHGSTFSTLKPFESSDFPTSILNQSAITTMAGSTTDENSGATTPLVHTHPVGVMVRAGQQGALYFDKANITDFLRRWNIECDDYNINDKRKCARIIDYCSPQTQEVIEVLDGYIESNWDKLQTELKDLFWQYDRQ